MMKGSQDSKTSIKIVEYHLLDWAEITHGESWKFQQHNVSIHVSNFSKQWFGNRNITILYWPSRALDVNNIENLWAVLARCVYYNSRQFRSVDDLIKVIFQEWDMLEDHALQGHIGSIQLRCIV